jgi:hypothetical protein
VTAITVAAPIAAHEEVEADRPAEIDAAALTTLACSAETPRLARFEPWGKVQIADGDGRRRELALCDGDWELGAGEYDVRIGAKRAIGIGSLGRTPTRWVYAGQVEPSARGVCRAELIFGDEATLSTWRDRWSLSADAAVIAARLVRRGVDHAVLLDGGGKPVSCYVGLDGNRAVALVLDAAGIGDGGGDSG